MTKTQLIESIVKATELDKATVEKSLNATLDCIKDSVKEGHDVTLIGFGTFTKSKRSARTGRNPQTGMAIEIKETTVPKFRPGRDFKEAVR
jgi:DNA-binding protein HU-beta